MTFKVGDKIRRCSDAVCGAPIGFETVVIEPKFDTGVGRVWYTNKYGEEVHGAVEAFELIQESPVRTETVRRLEPGVYGPIHIWREIGIPDCDRPDEPPQREVEVSFAATGTGLRSLNAPELRELARVALEIAEYLDAQ